MKKIWDSWWFNAAWFWMCVAIWSCGVSPEKHIANVAESAGYAAELADCRRQGRDAKKDGGAEAYMAAYESCASLADAKHGVTFSDGGAR